LAARLDPPLRPLAARLDRLLRPLAARVGPLLRPLAARLDPLLHPRRDGCQASLRFRQPALASLLGLSLLWLIIRPNPYALTGVVLCTSLVLLCYGWARSMALQVTVRRTLRFTALQVGESLEEVLILENSSRLPVIFAEFTDLSGLPGHSINGVRAGRACATEQWGTRSLCTRRGVFPIGRWETRLGDPFGLFEVRQIYRDPTEITVYPPLARIPRLVAHHRRTVGDRLSLRQALPADTVNAVTVRPYLPGEGLRRIHWRTSARLASLFVKNFEPEATTVVWLIADLDAAVQVGQGDESSLEKLIVLAGSLAAQLLGERLAVGLILDPQVVPPHPGKPHVWRILRALAGAEAGTTPLAERLRHVQRVVSVRESAVVLTPSVQLDWAAPLADLNAGATEVVLLESAPFDGSGRAATLAQHLRNRGVPTHVVRSADIRPMPGSHERLRRWEFQTLGTGRVIVRQRPRGSEG
jgi:uncharacterized protein (DUF58 family)